MTLSGAALFWLLGGLVWWTGSLVTFFALLLDRETDRKILMACWLWPAMALMALAVLLIRWPRREIAQWRVDMKDRETRRKFDQWLAQTQQGASQ